MTEACPLDAAAAAAAGRGNRRLDNQVIMMHHLQGSSATLSLVSSADVAAAGHHPADLAPPPSLAAEPSLLDDLCAVVAGFTGLDEISPRTAEIVSGIVAGLVRIRFSEGSSARDAALRWPDQVAPHPGEAAPYPYKEPAGRNGHRSRAHLMLVQPPTRPVEGQLCAVFAVDIVGFTRSGRNDDIRSYLHQRLYEYLEAAFDSAGIPWAKCFYEDRGDGVLVVIPPEISAGGLIDPLPEKLRGLIRRHNHVSTAAAQMQLRAAVTIGSLVYDGYGFVGTDVNFAFRMLAARSIKQKLAATGLELGIVVSDYVYRNLVCRYPSRVRPGAFQLIRFQSKNTRGRAWTYLPGDADPVSPVR